MKTEKVKIGAFSLDTPNYFPTIDKSVELNEFRRLRKNGNLKNCKGYVVNLQSVSNFAEQKSLDMNDIFNLKDSVLAVDPCTDFLFAFNVSELKKMLAISNIFTASVREKLKRAVKFDDGRSIPKTEKSRLRITTSELVSSSAGIIRRLHSMSDIIILPYPVLDYHHDLELLNPSDPKSITVLDNSIEAVKRIYAFYTNTYSRGKLAVPVICLLPNILKQDTERSVWHKIISGIGQIKSEFIGIKIASGNYLNDDSDFLKSVKDFISYMHKTLEELEIKKKIFFIGLDELFFVLASHGGIDIFSAPICQPIGIKRMGKRKSGWPGKYYHPKKMIKVSRLELMRITMKNDHEFPCECKLCKGRHVEDIDFSDWKGPFRRQHFLLCKNKEMEEVKRAINDGGNDLKVFLQRRLDESDRGDLAKLLK